MFVLPELKTMSSTDLCKLYEENNKNNCKGKSAIKLRLDNAEVVSDCGDFHFENFRYDEALNYFLCSLGIQLSLLKSQINFLVNYI